MHALRSRSLVGLLALFATAGLSCKKAGADAPLRLGFFPNITHAQALVGHAEGTFAAEPGMGPLEVKQFNAGPAAMEALVAGSLDVSYVGTGPAINTFLKAGRELRIIAGAVDGGAVLVTRTAKSAAELKGKKLASPQLGNTQDISLRYWLKQQGLQASTGVPGDVQIIPLSNPDILGQYLQGGIEGAWVPEPWGSRMVAEGGGHILVDERDLWPDRRFPTTVVVTTKRVLETRRPQLMALLRAHVRLTERWRTDPQGFQNAVNTAFGQLTRKPLAPELLQAAFSRLEPALEPGEAALATAAQHARALNYLTSDDISGLVDLSLLDEVRTPAR
ncbi:ABC transporter substrate-binding protein [Stigmatella aurantiaca]|uniref:ABC transporter, substrate-binding protein, aliphatic sulfonates family n=1 Tax=Stigmatella aurantiaca (strain DW4/3-1) TaxID=378806 RepID=Q09D23_STIAD|nr:ABC transporter substrate-binding protein [Stigmatella aurantiaca]ADO67890.1 ABC transporter, substrate-binding protein, aliphatic sulfonates family [Stigmatella aurantiaca DW4/3-1]EAU69667.1 sulfate ABC transporter substrate-binding protein [Stigmatella aurantiaca DW4/3-1]